MYQIYESFMERISSANTIDAGISAFHDVAESCGFNCIIYDYSPVAVDIDGLIITPSILIGRNIPSPMEDLWLRAGYYQIDPVQEVALQNGSSFKWSHDPLSLMKSDEVFVTSQRHSPVVEFLRDFQMNEGITTPIQSRSGDLATVTVATRGSSKNIPHDVQRWIPLINIMAMRFHKYILEHHDNVIFHKPYHLTKRQKLCLRLCAEGMTSKEIARKLQCSVPTVELHIQAATRRLSAKTRVEAVFKAMHYHLF